ncbi:hypothetical protein [Stieleria neptunia]|nr:hypothetical protein [Stieleria neptunia]
MNEKPTIEATSFFATVSLRTMMLFVAASAMCFGLTITDLREYGAFAPFAVFTAMMSLLSLTCVLCASLADDVWRDPGVTIVAGIYGLLGYSILISSRQNAGAPAGRSATAR